MFDHQTRPFSVTICDENHYLNTTCPLCGNQVTAEFTGEYFTTAQMRNIASAAIMQHLQHADHSLLNSATIIEPEITRTYIVAHDGTLWMESIDDEGRGLQPISAANAIAISTWLQTHIAQCDVAAHLIQNQLRSSKGNQ